MCSGIPSKRPDCQELLKTIEDWRVNEEEFDQVKKHVDSIALSQFDLISKIYSKLIHKVTLK